MAEYLIQSETLDEIAEAINARTGGASSMTPAEMVTAIGSISGGGGYSYIEHYQYVQAETKDFNSGGFTSWFVTTYITKGNGLYWGKITDVTDNPNQYKAVAFLAGKTSNLGVYGMFNRPTSWAGTITNDTSFYVYSGGVVDIWFIPETYFIS